jgi:hypothetical protein
MKVVVETTAKSMLHDLRDTTASIGWILDGKEAKTPFPSIAHRVTHLINPL